MKKVVMAISLILFAFIMFAHAEDTEEIVFLCKVPKTLNLMPAAEF